MGMDKHCVNEISFTNNFCFFLNLPVNNELGIVQDGAISSLSSVLNLPKTIRKVVASFLRS